MKDIFKQILLIIISVAIGFFVSEYKASRDNKINFIDYDIYSTKDVFNRFSSPKPQIKVKAGNQEISKVTQIEIRFINRGDKDFENVPIYIDFAGPNKIDFDIIGKSLTGDGGLVEGIENISLRETQQSPKIIRFSFTIKTLNRDRQWNQQPRATFLISGDTVPKVEIKTSKKGLDIREYDYKNYQSIIDSGVVVLIAYIVTLLATILIKRIYSSRRYLSKAKEHVRLVRQKIFANNSNFIDATPEQLKSISLMLFFANADEESHIHLEWLENYLRENANALQGCNENVANDFAQTIVKMEMNSWKKGRSRLQKLVSPIPEAEFE